MKNIDRIKKSRKEEREILDRMLRHENEMLGIIEIMKNLDNEVAGGWKFRLHMEPNDLYITVWNPSMFTSSDNRARFNIKKYGGLELYDDGDYAENITEIEAILNKWLSNDEEVIKNIDLIKTIFEKNNEMFDRIVKFRNEVTGGWKFRFCREHYSVYIYVWNPGMFELSDSAMFIIDSDGVLKVHEEGDYAKDIVEIKAILNKWLSEGEELKL